MDSRNRLHKILETYCSNVYYQPPSKLNYPCIIYSKGRVDIKYGNNKNYILHQNWELKVIERDYNKPCSTNLITSLTGVEVDREYIADNLYHTILTYKTIY